MFKFIFFISVLLTTIYCHEIQRLCSPFNYKKFGSKINSISFSRTRIFNLDFLNNYPLSALKSPEEVKNHLIFKEHILSYNTLSEANKTKLKSKIYDENFKLKSSGCKDQRFEFFENSKKVIELFENNTIPEIPDEYDQWGIFDQIGQSSHHPNITLFYYNMSEIYDLNIAVFEKYLERIYNHKKFNFISYRLALPSFDSSDNSRNCSDENLPKFFKDNILEAKKR